MKGFGIFVQNDLLEGKHIENMGIAVWLYMWLLDGITSINENGIGKVKGGRPILSQEVQEELSISDKTYRRWLEILYSAGYVNCIRAPHGTVITVNKAKKVFGQKRPITKKESSVNFVQSSVKKGRSSVTSDLSNNKTIQDNTKTIGKFVRKLETRSTESVVKERMRVLRGEGLSFKEIAEKLKQDER